VSNFEEEPQVESVDPQRHSPSTAERLDQVKEFMSRVVPWPEEHSHGWINLDWMLKRNAGGKKFWSGHPPPGREPFRLRRRATG
jgi:hypothetical protein